jgi:hypothetical protein
MNFKVKKPAFNKEDKPVAIGLTLYFIILVWIAITTNGTCDSGDSITHFLFSKYAFQHPENFLNHWAKPLFVLLSSPFTQFGFVGIKLFNCFVAVFTIWFTYKTAKKLNYKNAWLAAVFLCFTPGYFIHIFSGFTEPLFALMIIMSIYWLLNGRLVAALCLLSFLPFVRSEGLIIIIMFAFYLLINKQYKYLPWLLSGHIVYSIIGSFYYHDLLWVFTKIPYVGSSGKYGSGNLSHFIIQLNYIIGVPLYILFGVGLIKKIIESFTNKGRVENLAPFRGQETLLVYAVFIAFLAAHTLFWYFGIFESMGLKRVLIGVVPLAIIIALNGFNFITALVPAFAGSRYVSTILIGLVVVFPFVPNPASIDWNRDLSLSADEILITNALQSIKTTLLPNSSIYYTHPYISLMMNRDPFDKQYNHELKNITTEKRPEHYFVIWDNWFSVVENGISLEQLKQDTKLNLLKYFKTTDKDREIQVVVFEGKN